jgi:hypothetical protein
MLRLLLQQMLRFVVQHCRSNGCSKLPWPRQLTYSGV